MAYAAKTKQTAAFVRTPKSLAASSKTVPPTTGQIWPRGNQKQS